MNMTKPTSLDTQGLPVGYAFKPEYERTPRDAHAALVTNAAMIVDVRTNEEWNFAHIPGSIHIPLDQIEKRADEIELAPGQELLLLCHHGVRSMRAALALRQLGYPNALSIAGGIELWSLAADPSVNRYDRSSGQIRQI